MNILSPSILSADFTRLGDEVGSVDRAGAEYLHFDVMDGAFVPSISFGMPVLKAVRSITDRVVDVHLMIMHPEKYIKEFARLGADIITVHVEVCPDPAQIIKDIQSLGVKAGLTLNPETPIETVMPFVGMADMILIMTVHPGFGGQKYIPECTEKIRKVRQVIQENGYETDVEVDGGVNQENLPMVIEAGANVIVMGSAVFGEKTEENARKFVQMMREK